MILVVAAIPGLVVGALTGSPAVGGATIALVFGFVWYRLMVKPVMDAEGRPQKDPAQSARGTVFVFVAGSACVLAVVAVSWLLWDEAPPVWLLVAYSGFVSLFIYVRLANRN